MALSGLALTLVVASCSISDPSAPAAAPRTTSRAPTTQDPTTQEPTTSKPTTPETASPQPSTPSPDVSTQPSKPATLAFAGDVHFESPIREQLDADPRGLLDDIQPVLERADVAVVNLETAVTAGGDPAPKDYVFRAPDSAFDALRAAGVDVASMANNHGMDYGESGLRDSLAAAKAAGFPVIGIGTDEETAYRPYVTEVKGQRIAVIAATQVLDSHLISAWTAGPGKPGLASAKDEARLVEEVRRAGEVADVVVVYLHWGTELVGCPTADQQSLARKLVTAGADAVVGSHAHVLLGGGYLGDTYVHYGLGNFVFYAYSGPGIESGVLTLTVQDGGVREAEWTPARISSGVPVPLRGAAARAALEDWQDLRDCTGLEAKP